MKRFVVGLLAAFLMTATALPTWAAPEIGLSNDGDTFGPRLAEPIFDPSIRWVPGDEHTGSFYVRNQGPTRALMSITARSLRTDQLFSNDDVRLKARVAGGQWFTLTDGIASRDLTEVGIPPGRVVRVDVSASFLFSSPNASQLDPLRASFQVSLRHDPTDHSQQSHGGLPSTGGPQLWILVGGCAAAGLGSALVRRRRDQDQEAAHVAV